MEDALSKIRPHTSSTLDHQKAPALLLLAVEATFREQNTEPSPTAYFAALLTTLDATIQKKNIDLGEGAVLSAVLYLLALVAPYVPAPVLRTHAQAIIALTSPLFPSLSTHAPALRSQITLYHSVLRSLDRSQLDAQGVPQSFATILHLCIDPRPKVRRKAAELVNDVLAIPPAPLRCHPYAERVGDWVTAILTGLNESPFSRPKAGQTSGDVGADTAIRLLSFFRSIFMHLHPSALAPVIALLLPLPRLGNAYLTQSSYNLMSDVFRTQAEDTRQDAGDHIKGVMQVVIDSAPPISDHVLSPAWVEVLGNALSNYCKVDPEGSSRMLYKVWTSVWPFLVSTDGQTRKATTKSLQTICSCMTVATIRPALVNQHGHSSLREIISQLTKAFDSFVFSQCIPNLFAIASSLIQALRLKIDMYNQTSAELLLTSLIERIGDLRIQKGFEYKEAADSALSVAIHVIGPQAIFQILPLNLEVADRQAGREPRAFLLPLLAQSHPSPLEHFTSYFVPLSERLFDVQQKAEVAGRQSEAKVWSVLVVQIWNGFSGYFLGTTDLKRCLTPAFSQLLSQLLYTQPDLRLSVLKGLKAMVDINFTASRGQEQEDAFITAGEAAANVAFLRTQAESWLAVLFNVFGTVGRDNRTVVGNVITVWVNMAGEEGVAKAFAKVLALLKTQLGTQQNTGSHRGSEDDTPSATATTLDILHLLLPQLSVANATELFQVCLLNEVLGSSDGGMQKRGYKILTRLLQQSKLTIDPLAVFKDLDTMADRLLPAAKKDRFSLLSSLVPLTPASSLHIIPSLIPEGVLGTKEPSEKARHAAFDLILTMGHKMNEGGVVKRKMVDGMDEDGAQDDAVASIEEYMTMVAGGLAGASPHMISASITAISRLVFEFKDIISPETHSEIVTTSLVFLTSANREIVKSTIGFVKLAIHTLPLEILQPHLKDLVVTLLKWSHDHKNHFKLKVRHIFERMLRRFGWATVYACAEGEEASKVLMSIKKRKDRAKRKKLETVNEETVVTPRHTAGDAFEDVLYGSESEEGDSDEDMAEQHHSEKQSGKKRGVLGPRIRGDDDDPMDLLQGTASRITSGKAHKRKPRKDHFKTDEETGRMIVDDASSAEEGDDQVGGDAYYENLTSTDGFTRGVNGRIKFNKNTKKRRRELEDEDEEMVPVDVPSKLSPKQRKTGQQLGHEFKAKKAKGDMKKGGVDPYAYLSLSQAAKGGKNRLGIASKK
ncbi:NUC173-domain-containing protein [Pluteus cervinus]|uniref:NUC173-domain-containing protein n=1 Tax=Pluteus cervinus TaxID=181527 RepID=A0ACD3ASI6_9AGAR|nr:NUC173-domain-containing protein [Pluteus cervinus]